jgi:hypothetical protein
MTVMQAPLAPVSPWPMLAWTALPAALVIGGVGLIIRRRMALGGLEHDLQTQLGRIEQKVRAARAALQKEDARLLPIQERLTALKEGAYVLARQVQQVRSALALQNRAALVMDIKTLQKRLGSLEDEATKREGYLTLSEKTKSLSLLDEMCRAEERCLLRMAKIEAVLDSTSLGLRSAQTSVSTPPSEEAVCSALDAEVAAIREVALDLSAYQLSGTDKETENVARIGNHITRP